jgi:hypothetical protein
VHRCLTLTDACMLCCITLLSFQSAIQLIRSSPIVTLPLSLLFSCMYIHYLDITSSFAKAPGRSGACRIRCYTDAPLDAAPEPEVGRSCGFMKQYPPQADEGRVGCLYCADCIGNVEIGSPPYLDPSDDHVSARDRADIRPRHHRALTVPTQGLATLDILK